MLKSWSQFPPTQLVFRTKMATRWIKHIDIPKACECQWSLQRQKKKSGLMVWFEFARPSVAHYFESLFDKATGAGHASDSVCYPLQPPHRGLSWRSLSLSSGPPERGSIFSHTATTLHDKKKRKEKKGPCFGFMADLQQAPTSPQGAHKASWETECEQ